MCESGAIGFGFTSDWLRTWCKISKPIIIHSDCEEQLTSTNCQPTVGQQSANSQPTVGKESTNCRLTVGQLSAFSQWR